jgi:hypothetical protein
VGQFRRDLPQAPARVAQLGDHRPNRDGKLVGLGLKRSSRYRRIHLALVGRARRA